MKNEMDEVWAYDEPHESGGNCHITMTKRQAIRWTQKIYPYCYINNDEEAFIEWVNVHFAYKEKNEISNQITEEESKETV